MSDNETKKKPNLSFKELMYNIILYDIIFLIPFVILLVQTLENSDNPQLFWAWFIPTIVVLLMFGVLTLLLFMDKFRILKLKNV